MATPLEAEIAKLRASLEAAKTATRISGNKNSYRRDNPNEYDKVMAFVEGRGVRPTGTLTKMGEHLVYDRDVLNSLLSYQEPSPPAELGVDRATMTGTGGTILRNDNASQADPFPGLWGSGDYANISRIERYTTDGDTHAQVDGSSQGNTAYRRLNLLDGDNPGGFGERCDIGRNWWEEGENSGSQTNGTFKLGHEGDHFITFWSMRFPSSFPMSTGNWQQIGQYKQAQPYTDANIATQNPDGNGVAVEFQLYGSSFRLFTFWQQRWSTPAPPANTWIRMGLDMVFSKDPDIGRITVYIDNDGDGDWLDSDEMFEWEGATNSYVTTAHSGMSIGDTVPDVFFLGPYRNSVISGDTYIDIDNVQVYG